jgi:hypothetical protein
MTHGDQAKAKKANSSQASGIPKSSSKTAGQSGKGGSKAAGESSSKPLKKAGREKSGSAATVPKAVPAAKEGTSGKGGKARPVVAADDAVGGFSNAAVAAAFKRALKKYPNAFRKLTD